MPGTSQAWPHPTTLDAQERLGDWCGRGKGSHYVLSRVSPAPTPVPSLVWGNQGLRIWWLAGCPHTRLWSR